MAEDMIERAAQAIKDIQGPPFGTPEWLAKHGEKVLARQQRAAEQFARAALLAALDMSNDMAAFQVLVTALAVADDGHPDGLKYHEQAKAALLALHNHIAQGSSVSQEQVREKRACGPEEK